MKGINDLAKACSEKNKFLMVENKQMLKTLREVIKESINEDGICEIPGICTIYLYEKAEHISTNPRTKEKINVPKKILPKVKLNNSFKKEFTEILEK